MAPVRAEKAREDFRVAGALKAREADDLARARREAHAVDGGAPRDPSTLRRSAPWSVALAGN